MEKPDFRALCAELVAIFDAYDDQSNIQGVYDDIAAMNSNEYSALRRARAALAEYTSEDIKKRKINLALDTYLIDQFAETYMRGLGISYECSTPQLAADQHWFWGCTNVPDPLPEGLRILGIRPTEAIGLGLSGEKARKLEDKSDD